MSITDDDVPAVRVRFEQGAYTVVEGSTETVTVTLNADPGRTVIIPITNTDQGGASSADYSGVPASVTFNAGDTEVWDKSQLQRHSGPGQRRWREREAHLREQPADRGDRRDAPPRLWSPSRHDVKSTLTFPEDANYRDTVPAMAPQQVTRSTMTDYLADERFRHRGDLHAELPAMNGEVTTTGIEAMSRTSATGSGIDHPRSRSTVPSVSVSFEQADYTVVAS